MKQLDRTPALDKNLTVELVRALNVAGRSKVVESLRRLGSDESDTLTIIVNSGVHHLDDEYMRGDVFVASEGTLDFSSEKSVKIEFAKILSRVSAKLKSRSWRSIYIVPFGPAPLAMQIKLLVYRICGIESIDVMNLPGKSRMDVVIDLRKLITDAKSIK